MQPALYVVAGPPGSGKSSTFPTSRFGAKTFNADERAAEIWGAYRSIPLSIRSRVNEEFEQMIADHIANRQSFAFETTLRSPILFTQARMAQAAGFAVHMVYLNLESVELNIERVKLRADDGGHSARPELIKSIYEASLRNLPRAIRETNSIAVIDNTVRGEQKLLLDAVEGLVQYLAPDAPEWLDRTLWGTEYELSRIHDELEQVPRNR